MQSIAEIAQAIQPGNNGNGSRDNEPRAIRAATRTKLDSLDTSEPQVAYAVQQAREWAKRKRGGYMDTSMVLSGPFGTGKTHIAKAILWSIVDEVPGHPDSAVPAGRFYMANDLLLRLGSIQDKSSGIVTPVRTSSLVGNAPIVIIDDVGGQQIIPFVAGPDQKHERHARYFRFIDYCYTDMVSVIMTTNLSIGGLELSDFAKHIGGRAFDRLAQMAPRGFMIGLDGVTSWRQKAGGR